jgi:signal transduction histidine kinase
MSRVVARGYVAWREERRVTEPFSEPPAPSGSYRDAGHSTRALTARERARHQGRTFSELHAIAIFDAAGELTWSSGLGGLADEPGTRSGAPGGESREQVLMSWIRRMAWVNGDALAADLRGLGSREEDVDIRTVDGRVMRLMQRQTRDGGLVLVFIDRTDEEYRMRMLEDLIHETRTAERATLDRLSSLISELRTPVQTVLGFAQLMARDQRDRLPPRHEARVQEITNAVEQLSQMLNHLVELTSEP